MISTVIFDMDGVVVDSEIYWKILENELFGKLIPNWDIEGHVKNVAGMNIHRVFDFMKTKHGLRMEKGEFLKAFDDMAERIYKEKASLLPNLLGFIKGLRKAGFKIALASSSSMSWINMVMERFKISELFDRIVSAEHVGNQGKPAPDIYLHTALLLDSSPKECVVIEDTRNGVLAAKNASMKCIGIVNKNQDQDLSLADKVINDFSELSIENIRNM